MSPPRVSSSSTWMPALLLLVVACCSLPRPAVSHGGGLHRWTFNPKVLNVIKTASLRTNPNIQVATCGATAFGGSPWKVLNLTALAPSLYTLPFFKPTKNITVSGTLDVVQYLGGPPACTATSGLFPFLQLKEWYRSKGRLLSKSAATNTVVYGYGFSGTCSAPTNLYRNNATLQDSRFNLAWWNGVEGAVGTGMNFTDIYPGYLWGAGVNSWLVGNSTAANRLRSVVLIIESGPAFCCDLSYAGFPEPQEILKQQATCQTPSNATNVTNTTQYNHRAL